MPFCLSAYLSGRVIKVTCYETVLHSGMPIIILENQLETLLHLDLVSEAFGVILMIWNVGYGTLLMNPWKFSAKKVWHYSSKSLLWL